MANRIKLVMPHCHCTFINITHCRQLAILYGCCDSLSRQNDSCKFSIDLQEVVVLPQLLNCYVHLPIGMQGFVLCRKIYICNVVSNIANFGLSACCDCRTYRPTNPNVTRTMAVQISWESGGVKNNLMPPLGHMPNRFRTACVGWGTCPVQYSLCRYSHIQYSLHNECFSQLVQRAVFHGPKDFSKCHSRCPSAWAWRRALWCAIIALVLCQWLF